MAVDQTNITFTDNFNTQTWRGDTTIDGQLPIDGLPLASLRGGMNDGNGPLGINPNAGAISGFDNTTAAGAPTNSDWTLIDQHGNQRIQAQPSQRLGGTGWCGRDPTAVQGTVPVAQPVYTAYPDSGGTPGWGRAPNQVNSSVFIAERGEDSSGEGIVLGSAKLETLEQGWIDYTAP